MFLNWSPHWDQIPVYLAFLMIEMLFFLTAWFGRKKSNWLDLRHRGSSEIKKDDHLRLLAWHYLIWWWKYWKRVKFFSIFLMTQLHSTERTLIFLLTLLTGHKRSQNVSSVHKVGSDSLVHAWQYAPLFVVIRLMWLGWRIQTAMWDRSGSKFEGTD